MRFLLLVFLAVSRPVFAQESNPLVGTWKLISSESIMENEAPQHTFGPHPKGYLVITQEGRLMIMITADNRQVGMGDAERAAMHKTMGRPVARSVLKARTSSLASTFRGMNRGTVRNRGATSRSKPINSSLKQHQAQASYSRTKRALEG